ncbi:IS3 family transposase, partial [Heyndrickxia ginsengihumi]
PTNIIEPKKARGARKAGGEEKTILTTDEKYTLIEKTIRTHQLKKFVSYLCERAGVSGSGYYDWLNAAPIRAQHDEQDEMDVKLI